MLSVLPSTEASAKTIGQKNREMYKSINAGSEALPFEQMSVAGIVADVISEIGVHASHDTDKAS